MVRFNYEKQRPLEEFFGVVCPVLRCPGCGTDLTGQDTLNVTFGLDYATFELWSRLVPVGTTGVGVVEDVSRLIACGFESCLRCNRCGEDLSEHEWSFTWQRPEEYRQRLEEAAAEAASEAEEEDPCLVEGE